MVDDDAKPWAEVLRSLEQSGQRRRDLRRQGSKIVALAKLARASIPIPRGWVLEASHYDAFVERCLPHRHDLRSLIKLAGTRGGDERCARAYEEMLAEPLDETLVAAVAALWEEELQQMPAGVAVRPSVAASGRASAASRHLHSQVGVRSLEDLLAAIRSVWASSTLAVAVAAYAAAGLKEVSVALLLQQVVATDHVGTLTRTIGPSEPVAGSDWHLGVALPDKEGALWRRRGELLLPLSLGRGGDEPPPPLSAICAALEPDGYEQLIELGTEGERVLGDSAVFHFAVERKQPGQPCQVHVLAADDSPRWQPLAGGDDFTTWVELTVGARTPEPPTRLTQSILERTADGSLQALLKRLGCKVDQDASLVGSWAGRSYLNANALLALTRDVPLLSPEDVLTAVGGVGPVRRRALAGRAASRGRSMWRSPLVGVSALRDQVGIEREVASLERTIERDARGLDDMDLAVLPSDAMGVTLASAQALLERTSELWVDCAASQLSHALALRGIVRRRLPEAEPRIGYALLAGSGRSFGATMTAEIARVVEVFRRDPRAAARLGDREVRCAADLPDGAGRGALGQFLGRYGDMCIGAAELSAPRWREDASDLMHMLSLILRHPSAVQVEAMNQTARAAADAQLAHYEAELNLVERRLLRAILDRGRRLTQGRATVDRLLFRALAMVRRVVLDIGRRLDRVDYTLGEADGVGDSDVEGAFHCSAERLMGALKSGRPELTRTIRMRQVERHHQSREPAPPLCFVGSPPRGGIPVMSAPVLEGLGVSPGVVEGRVRIIDRMLPHDLEPGDILVTNGLDVALAPLCLLAAGLISEAGGDLSLGVETARELGVPAVTSVPNAGLRLEDRERVRIDGASGRVQRLDHEPDPRSREPIPTGEQAVP